MKASFLLILITIWYLNSIAQSHSAIFKGDLHFVKSGDSIIVIIYEHPPFNIEQTIVSKVKRGKFYFRIPVNKSPFYISVIFPNKGSNSDGSKNIYGFLMEKDDHINYSIYKNNPSFSGLGSKKWGIQGNLASLVRNVYFKNDYNKNISGIIEKFKFDDSLFSLKSKLLRKNKRDLGNFEYKLLLADNIAQLRNSKSVELKYYNTSQGDLSVFLSGYKDIPVNNYFSKSDSSTILAISISYCAGIIEKYKLDSCYLREMKFSVAKAYYDFKTHYSGKLRDNLLTLLLLKNRRSSENITKFLGDAFNTIDDPENLNVLREVKALQLNGTVADNFTLPDTLGKNVSLSDFKGKTVLLDFWFTGCTPCRLMAKELKKLELRLNPDSVVIVSINVDKNKERWISSVRSGLYTSPHAFILNTQLLGTEHPLIKHYSITGFPTLMVIDKNGRFKRNPKNPMSDNAEDLIYLLQH
jgi:thiol-disulfide isomerase/thioredoxin